MISLAQLNRLPAPDFIAALGAIFEHSPWVPERVASLRPFASAIAMHRAMCDAVLGAVVDAQLALIRAHPELAGRAAIRGDLTAASTNEQRRAGLAACTPEELTQLQSLNAQYQRRFGFPFVLAVKGHTPPSVIATLATRVAHDADTERRVALEQICRIARFRLADLVEEPVGEAVLAMADDLAALSDEAGALTCAYLTPAHRATADRIREFMLAAGLDVHIDTLGNVHGTLAGAEPSRPVLMTGSHYDTVINGGKYDGRLGILLPVIVAGRLARSGRRLPYPLEIVAFAEEEGVRFKSTFLGSRALVGRFDHGLLEARDAAGMSLRTAIESTGGVIADIAAIARRPQDLAGFIEIHIEQGPVLLDADLAVGVVSSIAGSIRSLVKITGLAGHAGTVPMGSRRDAAAAAAEIVLAVERRCSNEPGLVGTVGKLEVPGGAINVIPGRCDLSIDVRCGNDTARDRAFHDIGLEMEHIAARRGVGLEQRTVLEVAAVPCDMGLARAWSKSIARVTGRPAHALPSGAGHDAMMMANITPIGMLFVRCGNGGISHHPDESLNAADASLAAQVFEDFLIHFGVPE